MNVKQRDKVIEDIKIQLNSANSELNHKYFNQREEIEKLNMNIMWTIYCCKWVQRKNEIMKELEKSKEGVQSDIKRKLPATSRSKNNNNISNKIRKQYKK